MAHQNYRKKSNTGVEKLRSEGVKMRFSIRGCNWIKSMKRSTTQELKSLTLRRGKSIPDGKNGGLNNVK